MRFPYLLAAAALFSAVFPCNLPAQSTPTEREAARDIVRQIDELQTRIGSTEMAQRLVAAGGADRDRILRRVEQLWTSEFRALSDHIGRNPEVGWKEFKAVDTLTKVLRARDFAVDRSGRARDGVRRDVGLSSRYSGADPRCDRRVRRLTRHSGSVPRLPA